MAFTMRSMASGRGPLAANATAEIGSAVSQASTIRLLDTGVVNLAAEQADFARAVAWQLPSAATVGGDPASLWSGFSATCWYYGREISKLTNGRPVGLIMAAQGATAIESWMSAGSLYGRNSTNVNGSSCPATLDNGQGMIPGNSASPPTSNFNGQIAPLTRLTIKGVIW
jgi:hypothetical protein